MEIHQRYENQFPLSFTQIQWSGFLENNNNKKGTEFAAVAA